MSANPAGFPLSNEPFTNPATGIITRGWRQFLVSLWNRTGAGGGTTVYASGMVSIMDPPYYAKCDVNQYTLVGTDDSTAWNAAIADINSGAIWGVFVPGLSYYTGAMPAITQGFAFIGTGNPHSGVIQKGAADVTMLNVDFLTGSPTPAIGSRHRYHLADMFLGTIAAFSGQAATIKAHPAGSGHVMRGVVAGGWPTSFNDPVTATKHGFKRGIELIDVNSGYHEGCFVHGTVVDASGAFPLNVLNTEYGWYVHTAGADASDNNRWVNCDCNWCIAGWKGRGHLEGLFFVSCNPGFVGYGFDIQCSGVANPPCFEWTACQTECFYDSLLLDNLSGVQINECQFYQDTYIAGSFYAVRATNIIRFKVAESIMIPSGGGGTSLVGFLKATDVVDGKSSSNTFTAVTNYGVWWNGTSSQCTSDGDRCMYPGAGAIPYENAANSPADANYATALTNKRRNWEMTGATAAQGQTPIKVADATVGVLPFAQTVYLQAVLGLKIGDQIKVQTSGFLDLIAGETSPQMVVREYNHRPATADPVVVLHRSGDDRVNAIRWWHITADKGQEHLDEEWTFDVVASRNDCNITLELNSAGALGNTCNYHRSGLLVDRV